MENNQKENLVLVNDLGMLYPNEKLKYKARMAIYKCHCGKEFKTFVNAVKTNTIKSCGCSNSKAKKVTYPKSITKHRIYNVWKSFIQRCSNKNHKDFKDYGERGITVCDYWNNPENFINDMFPSYQEGLSIDRIDVNGNYCLNNCRWTTKSVQSRNTRILRIDNTTGYRGVCLRKDKNKFVAQIRVNSKRIYVGTYNTAIEAAKAYDKYVIDNNLEHTKNF